MKIEETMFSNHHGNNIKGLDPKPQTPFRNPEAVDDRSVIRVNPVTNLTVHNFLNADKLILFLCGNSKTW